MKKTALVVAALISLAACKEEEMTVVEEDDGCGAQAQQVLVGQGREALAGFEPGPKLRILEPGMAMTMDFRFDRLNIELDEAGKVTRVFCG